MSRTLDKTTHHESSHYIKWDAKVCHVFGNPPSGWRECGRGLDYIRFTDSKEVVQIPDGPNGYETVHQGSDEAIARNNALAVMMND